MSRVIPFLIAVLLPAVVSAAGPNYRLRLIVVDESRSMEGEHIEDVKADLLKYVQDDPPSRTAPIGVIRFAEQAKPTVWCFDADSATRCIELINADGESTSIATGLAEALAKLKKHAGKANVELYLYTDDQDDTPEETERIVAELSSLFSSRKVSKLAQSVIIRTWSQAGAGSTIEAMLQGNPDVTVSHRNDPVFIGAQVAPPPPVRKYSLTLDAEATGAVRWEDWDARLLIYEVRWALMASATAAGPDSEFAVQVEGVENATLVATPAPMAASTVQGAKGTLEIRVQLTDEEIEQGNLLREPTLHLAVTDHPADLSFDQAVVSAPVASLPAPPQQRTKIAMEVAAVEPGVWYESPNIAFYRVRTRVTVDGPLPSGSKLQLTGPAGVTRIKLLPDTVKPGDQEIVMLIAAVAEPAPVEVELEFLVEPPDDTAMIAFEPVAPFTVRAVGPERLRLHAGESQSPDLLSTHRWEARSEATLPVRLWFDGPALGRFTHACQVRLSGDAVVGGPVDASLYQVRTVPLLDPTASAPSYFFDSVDTYSIEARPTGVSAVVVPAAIQAEVRTYAPFKIHLCGGLTVLALLGGAASVLHFIRSLGVSGSADEWTGEDE